MADIEREIEPNRMQKNSMNLVVLLSGLNTLRNSSLSKNKSVIVSRNVFNLSSAIYSFKKGINFFQNFFIFARFPIQFDKLNFKYIFNYCKFNLARLLHSL